MSEDVSKQTLRDICLILKENFKEFASIFNSQNEKMIKMRQRGRKVLKDTTSTCCPTCSRPYQSTGREKLETVPGKEPMTAVKENIVPPSELKETGHRNIPVRLSSITTSNDCPSDETVQGVQSNNYYVFDRIDSNDSNYSQNSAQDKSEILFANEYLKEENLSIMRECVDLKVNMRLIELEIKDLRRETAEDEDVCRHLGTIDGILTKVLRSQTVAENLCDKLCEGLDKFNQYSAELPPEMKSFCDRIRKTVGQDYRDIGTALGLDGKTLNEIDNDFEEEDRLYQIVFKLSTLEKMPSVHDVVTACHNVNPSILKCRPLANAKAQILERQYSFLYDEMHEIAVLPHLVSSGVMTLKQSQYVLKAQTKDQRIYRLITVICTRQNGFDKLCAALDMSDQQHVSDVLKASIMNSDEYMDDSQVCSADKTVPLDLPNEPMPANIPLRRRNYSLNDLDVDDGKCSEMSFASTPANLDPTIILKKIVEMIQQAGLTRQ